MNRSTYASRVTALRDVAPEVRELTLSAPVPDGPPLEFLPGQWLSLHLPVGERPPLVRAYSLAAPPSPSGELLLCLDRVEGGLGSEYLFSLEAGDELAFQGPLGSFVLPEGERELLWIARYTGVVPFRAMLLHLLEAPPARPVTLLYEAPRPGALPYLEELLRAAAGRDWLTVVPVVQEAGEDWQGARGTVLDLLPERVGERQDLVPMVCGTREFVRAVRDFFAERGYERRAVKWESYD